jgi:hypothetical protein
MAQTARKVRGAAAVEPLRNERLIMDPPLAESLSHGRMVIQYRTENLYTVPVFGPAGLAVSPRVRHSRVTPRGTGQTPAAKPELEAHRRSEFSL